jgi:glutathione S-transferase
MRQNDATAYDFIGDPSRRRIAQQAFASGQTPAAAARPAAAPSATPQREHIVFYDFPSSPFCIKVRAMLHHKGLRFSAVDALQPARWLQLQRRGSGKVPAIEIDGRFIGDSTDIAYELERLFPANPLLPTCARQRALCHALEEWADESMYFIGLYHHWLHPQDRHRVQRVFGRGLTGRVAYRLYHWRVERQVHAQGTGRKTPAAIEHDLARHLDAAQALLGTSGFLLGPTPWLCDFALFGQLSYLLAARSSRAFVQAHPPLVAYVERLRGRPA